jgi:hypothetical protein
LDLIFLKYISDAFNERHAQLQKEIRQSVGLDEYRADNIFSVLSESQVRMSRPRSHNPSHWRI